MSQLIKLSENNQLKDSQCLTINVEHQNTELDLILLCYAPEQYQVFINKCPHTGVNLNWQENQCFDMEQKFLMCSLHGALFQPEDGLCVYGPCSGQSLKAVDFIQTEEGIFIDLENVDTL